MRTDLRRGAVVSLLLILILAGFRCSEAPANNEARTLWQRASRYLISQQADDGGWHSTTHAILRSGQALTPFILSVFLESPETATTEQAEAINRGMSFIRQHVREDGVLGVAEPLILEYPNYATSYALRAMIRQSNQRDSMLIRRMTEYLVGQQFDESRGIDTDHPAYGGWGFGETTLPGGQVGHTDLSHTRRILEALRIAGVDGEVFENAQVFLDTVQQKQGADNAHLDGGFYYSPVVIAANKGGAVIRTDDELVFRSYATATCDGLLALLATGKSVTDPALQDAVSWLNEHTTLAFPEGIPQDQPAQWHEVLFFYHLAARAAVYQQIGWPDTARRNMIKLLKTRIEPNGSFVNPLGAPNKENDPLLATALAVQTLQYMLE